MPSLKKCKNCGKINVFSICAGSYEADDNMYWNRNNKIEMDADGNLESIGIESGISFCLNCGMVPNISKIRKEVKAFFEENGVERGADSDDSDDSD